MGSFFFAFRLCGSSSPEPPVTPTNSKKVVAVVKKKTLGNLNTVGQKKTASKWSPQTFDYARESMKNNEIGFPDDRLFFALLFRSFRLQCFPTYTWSHVLECVQIYAYVRIIDFDIVLLGIVLSDCGNGPILRPNKYSRFGFSRMRLLTSFLPTQFSYLQAKTLFFIH